LAVITAFDLGNQPVSVVFRGQSHYHEKWAWWSTPAQAILLVPAACWDVLTAIVQIPYYLAGDMVHSALSLGDPGNGNPWRRLDKPSRYLSPRFADPQNHRILITPAIYDDMQFKEAGWQNTLTSYRQYLRQFPAGQHVIEATNQIARFQEIEEDKRYQKALNSIPDLKRFLEENPSAKFAENARPELDRRLRHVTVNRPESKTNSVQGAHWESTNYYRTFIVGTTTRADIESFLGPGTPETPSKTLKTAAYNWPVKFQRGISFGWYSDGDPRNSVRKLRLLFDSEDRLLEIDGE
jgi:hypothetical protein